MARTRGYAFGDDEDAAQRLVELANLYQPTSESFIAAHGHPQPQLAIDLGCGPGHTTDLLARTLQPARTVGLDESDPFLERARQTYGDYRFTRHDVTTTPFPPGAPNVAYARFVLAHVEQPLRVAAAWIAALAPGGTLLMEEAVQLTPTHPACVRYLELITATLAAEGRDMLIGDQLLSFTPSNGTVTHAAVATIREAARRYALLFLPNLNHWGPRAIEHGVATAHDIDRVRSGLEGLLTGNASGIVTADIAQVAITASA